MDVSVIICTYNRCQSLQTTLVSLLSLEVPEGLAWEVLVVDNNSTDQTKTVVEDFAAKVPFSVTRVLETEPGLSEARNAGLRHAKGEIISFLDDDVLVFPDWLTEVCKGFALVGTACLGGKALLPPGLKFPRWWDHSYDGPIGNCNLGDEILTSETKNLNIIGANLSFRRIVFEKFGFFSSKVGRKGTNLSMGEETEFISRLQTQGLLAGYYPRATVYHVPDPNRMTISYLSRWHYRRGEWEGYTNRDRPQSPGMVSWFGAPRWLYGAALQTMLRTCINALAFRIRKALYLHFQVCFYVGYLIAYFKFRRQRLVHPVAGVEIS